MRPHWIERYRQHFQNYFGKPFDSQPFRPEEGPAIEIVTYDQRYKKFRVFASLGLAQYALDVKELAEVIVVADTAWRDVPVLFVNTLFFAVQQRISLDSRFAIGVASLNPAFAEHFDKSALFFTVADGFGEGFEQVNCGDATGLVYQGIFISPAEQDFLARHGGPAFEEKLRAQDADLCSLHRPSCV